MSTGVGTAEIESAELDAAMVEYDSDGVVRNAVGRGRGPRDRGASALGSVAALDMGER